MRKRKQYVPKRIEDPIGEHVWDGTSYRRGQKVYCRRHVDRRVCLGQIDQIFPKGEESHFSFTDEATGKHEVAYFRDIIPNPSPADINSVNADIVKNNKVIKDLKK